MAYIIFLSIMNLCNKIHLYIKIVNRMFGFSPISSFGVDKYCNKYYFVNILISLYDIASYSYIHNILETMESLILAQNERWRYA